MSLPSLNRRQFVKGTLAAAGAGFAISGTKSSGRIIGANDTVRVAIAGLNGRGGEHVGQFVKMPNVAITYLVDPDTRTYVKRLQEIDRKHGPAPATVANIRQALDDKSVDAISVATPNHWHALITIWACQAGKDVYVEKPCSHNIHEGRIAVEAARRMVGSCSMAHRADPATTGPWPRLQFSPANSASSKCHGHCATNPAVASESKRSQHRRTRSISIPGSVRHPSNPITPISSITTGIGSGISATATLAIKGSIRWTSALADSRGWFSQPWCQRNLSQNGPQPWRPIWLSRPRGDGQYAGHCHGFRRDPAYLRGPGPEYRPVPG